MKWLVELEDEDDGYINEVFEVEASSKAHAVWLAEQLWGWTLGPRLVEAVPLT